MNIDKLFSEVVGDLGYQQILYCLLFCLMNSYGAFQMLQSKFVVRDTSNFLCHISVEEGKPAVALLNTCTASEKTTNARTNCLQVTYPDETFPSLMSEWDLICDRAWMGPMVMSLQMAGVMVGSIILGSLADRIGRRRTLSLAFTTLILVNLAGAYAPNFITYVIMRFMCGFCQSGVILASFVLMNEIVGSSKRALVGVITQSFFAFGIMILSLMSYYVRSWRDLTIYISIIGLPFALLIMFYLPESPRWLKGMGNIKEALNVLKHITIKNGNIAKWKGGYSARWSSLIQENRETENDDFTSTRASIGDDDSILDLFRHPILLQLTLIQLFSWFVNGATYYGLTLAAGSNGEDDSQDKSSERTSDIYTSTALSGLVELPACIVAIPLLNSFGRRKTLVLFMVVGGLSCLIISAVEKIAIFKPYNLTMYLALLGKLCISTSFSVVFIHSNEIFPTTIRNSAMGLVSFATRIGGILAPFLAKLGKVWPNMHFMIFGVMTIISGILNILLPETKNVPLPENIETLILMQSSKTKNSGYPTSKMKSKENGYQHVAIDDMLDDSSDLN